MLQRKPRFFSGELESEQGAKDQTREALVAAERKAHAVQNELEETKTQLELVRVINILLIYSSANNINLT